MSTFALLTDYESVSPSGYGYIMANIGRQLTARGHTVFMYAFENDNVVHDEPFPIIPTSPRVILSQLQHIQDGLDFVLSACDLTIHSMMAPMLNTFPYAGIFVIEGDAIQHPTKLSASIQQIKVPMVVTKYGQVICQDLGVDAKYLPMGVDTELHKPDMDVRQDARKRMGFKDDDIIVLTVADNHERKNHPLNMEAFAGFAEKHDNAYYIVISRQRPAHIAWDLWALARANGIEDKVAIYDQGVPRDRLIQFYQSSDMFLSLSACEGFGLPLLEAMACGIPCVATDSSGMREQITDAGAGGLVESAYTYNHPLLNSTRQFANPVIAAGMLEHVWQDLEAQSKQARVYAESMQWSNSVDNLEEILNEWKKEQEAAETPGEANSLTERLGQFVLEE